MSINRFDEGFDAADHWELERDPVPCESKPDDQSRDEPMGSYAAGHQAAGEPLGSPLAGPAVGEQGNGKPSSPPFIKGPLCREWFVRAMQLRKPAVMAGLALWFKAGVTRDDFIRGRRAESIAVRVDRGLKKSFGISPSQMSRGLQALAGAGLIRIAKGGAGRCPVVAIVNIQIPRGGSRFNAK